MINSGWIILIGLIAILLVAIVFVLKKDSFQSDSIFKNLFGSNNNNNRLNEGLLNNSNDFSKSQKFNDNHNHNDVSDYKVKMNSNDSKYTEQSYYQSMSAS